MRSLPCSLADGVLPDAILSSPCTLLPPINIRNGRGHRKSTETKNRKKQKKMRCRDG